MDGEMRTISKIIVQFVSKDISLKHQSKTNDENDEDGIKGKFFSLDNICIPHPPPRRRRRADIQRSHGAGCFDNILCVRGRSQDGCRFPKNKFTMNSVGIRFEICFRSRF